MAVSGTPPAPPSFVSVPPTIFGPAQLPAGVTLLTGSRRLAHSLLQLHAQHAISQGLLAWRTPRILPWSAWLRLQWVAQRAGSNDTPQLRLLTPAQARVLWSEIVGASDAGTELLAPASAARLAARSWRRIQEYLIPLHELADAGTAEALALSQWCAQFEERCRSLQAMDESRLLHWAYEQALAPREPLAVAGFDVVPPALQRLFDRWREQGLLVTYEPPAVDDRAVQRRVDVIAAPEREAELELAARWARAQWARSVDDPLADGPIGVPPPGSSSIGSSSPGSSSIRAQSIQMSPISASPTSSQPSAIQPAGSPSGADRRRIGVVVPGLQQQRAAVRRIFEDVFAPGRRAVGQDPRQDPQSLPVSIAASQPLLDYPIVEAAMLILQFAIAGRSSVHAGRLLRSAFIGDAERERDQRALADFRLRKEQREQWDWFGMERWAGVTQCERLQRLARDLCAQLREGTTAVQPSGWAERFHAWLKAAGWPGERTLDSLEHQTHRKFLSALAELGTLDAVSARLELPAALARLRDLLADTPFEPETPPGVVTVIDPATVAGMSFDALWVTGLDAASLPGPVDPDPLIPLSMQRDAGVPESRAQDVLRLARQRLERWVAGAAEVVLSWPQQEGEAELRPSALLTPYAGRAAAEPLVFARTTPWRRTQFEQRPRLEELLDLRAPAVARRAARGGAMILELQSRCPFRAQAELRLGALALPRVSLGVEPLDRGTILHRVLAELWKSLGTQSALLARPEQELLEQVRAAAQRQVASALQPAARHRAQLAALEVEYATTQVMRLLTLEKTRPPFVVRFAETSEAHDIGGLAITLQPDRIDELDESRSEGRGGGGQLLIDYKLGDSHQPRQWLDAWPGRPKRPQLPLYALAHESSLRALAFVVMAPGTVEYRGWSDGAEVGAGIRAYPQGVRTSAGAPPDWPSLLAHWRVTLTELARAHLAGEAEVDPLPQECAYCHLSALCRIHDRSRTEADMEEVDDEQ